MEIIKSKRKSKCVICWKPITQKYKVIISSDNHNYFYHLSCYFNRLQRSLIGTKEDMKKFSKQKYKRQMILENLK